MRKRGEDEEERRRRGGREEKTRKRRRRGFPHLAHVRPRGSRHLRQQTLTLTCRSGHHGDRFHRGVGGRRQGDRHLGGVRHQVGQRGGEGGQRERSRRGEGPQITCGHLEGERPILTSPLQLQLLIIIIIIITTLL